MLPNAFLVPERIASSMGTASLRTSARSRRAGASWGAERLEVDTFPSVHGIEQFLLAGGPFGRARSVQCPWSHAAGGTAATRSTAHSSRRRLTVRMNFSAMPACSPCSASVVNHSSGGAEAEKKSAGASGAV